LRGGAGGGTIAGVTDCPYCGERRLRWSRVGWFELPLLLMLLRPDRCHHYYRRGYRPVWFKGG